MSPFRRTLGPSLLRIVWILTFLSFLYVPSVQSDSRDEFQTYDVTTPTIFPPRRLKRDMTSQEKQEENLSVSYTAFGREYTLDLKMNKNLFPAHYFQKHHKGGNYEIEKPMNESSGHCYYLGKLRGKPNSWAAVSTCKGVSGMVYDGEETHHIEPQESSLEHLVFKESHLIPKDLKCGYQASHSASSHQLLENLLRAKRSLSEVEYDPYRSNAASRYVELVIVNDNQEFKERSQSKEAVYERSREIANIVNGLYAPLNIFIALVGVVVWSEKDEIKISTDGDTTLTNFLHYRRQRLVSEHPNDNAQLITGLKFDGGVVGKALKGPICTWEFSGGVNMDHSKVVGLVATTVAHELGHNFGMEHDAENCRCPDEKCIMSPASGHISPRHWSACSKEYLQHAYKQGMDYCLRNRPPEVVGPVCGNGYLETGEQCDCGMPEFCDNSCCNAVTCRLHPNASCATGSCCDMRTCQVKHVSTPCREVQTECDLPEYCDGQSEFCPKDVYIQDGYECGNGKAYCYHGMCKSHNDQCHLLWGHSGKMSEPKCFDQNIHGNDTGNCGYYKPTKTHKACAKEDVMCGLLHCVHLNERLEFGMESAATVAHSFIPHRGKTLICRSAIVDLGLRNMDPGLAPNGAKCGVGKACLNQACVPVSKLYEPNGFVHCINGIGNNKRNCHCSPGYAPPFCDSPGPGGSLDSGPPSDPDASYHFLVAMYVIFLCIVPLTAIAAVGIYYFRKHLKVWWIAKARKAAIKSRAKQAAQRKPRPPSQFNTDLRNVEISAPLPQDPGAPSECSSLSRSSSILKGQPLRSLEISPPIPQSTTNEQVVKLVPVRPAPPRPHVSPQRTPSWAGHHAPNFATVNRSASMRTGTDGRPLSSAMVARPNCPPPRPPPPSTAKPPLILSHSSSLFHNNTEIPNQVQREPSPYYDDCNGALDFSDTPLAFVHQGPERPGSKPQPVYRNTHWTPLASMNSVRQTPNVHGKVPVGQDWRTNADTSETNLGSRPIRPNWNATKNSFTAKPSLEFNREAKALHPAPQQASVASLAQRFEKRDEIMNRPMFRSNKPSFHASSTENALS